MLENLCIFLYYYANVLPTTYSSQQYYQVLIVATTEISYTKYPHYQCSAVTTCSPRVAAP